MVNYKRTREVLKKRMLDFEQDDKRLVRFWLGRYKPEISPYFEGNILEEAVRKAPRERETLLKVLADITTSKTGVRLFTSSVFELTLYRGLYGLAAHIYRTAPRVIFTSTEGFRNGLEFAAYLYRVKGGPEKLRDLITEIAKTNKALITATVIREVSAVDSELGKALKLAKLPKRKQKSWWEKVKEALNALLYGPRPHQDKVRFQQL